jgi:hypothetical protein
MAKNPISAEDPNVETTKSRYDEIKEYAQPFFAEYETAECLYLLDKVESIEVFLPANLSLAEYYASQEKYKLHKITR